MRTTASEALIFVHVRRFDTQNLVKLGRRRGVLQEHTLFREDVVASGKGSERTFMEARQDELLLARIGIDVANSEDTRDVRFKASRVDNDLLTFQGEASFRSGQAWAAGQRRPRGGQAEYDALRRRHQRRVLR